MDNGPISEGTTFPVSPYQGQSFYLTAPQTINSVVYAPGQYIYNSTATPAWGPFTDNSPVTT